MLGSATGEDKPPVPPPPLPGQLELLFWATQASSFPSGDWLIETLSLEAMPVTVKGGNGGVGAVLLLGRATDRQALRLLSQAVVEGG